MNTAPHPGIDRPYTILIAALGGEGGGLLTDWIIDAATRAGLLVQATSIPGLAQRTGATTYYIEMMQEAADAEAEPLFGLYPAPGYIDMAVASELIEAGRLIESGFVTPDQTALIASTHRIFSMHERTAMSEGAFPAPKIIDTAHAFARTHMLRDFAALSQTTGTVLNALLMGAMSAQDGFPLELKHIEAAITERGVAVDANLKGLSAGRKLAKAKQQPATQEATDTTSSSTGAPASIDQYPEAVHDILQIAVERLTEYQDRAYADTYLERLATVRDALVGSSDDHTALRETARYLALWMAYEDVLRVADLKSRASRYRRVRSETAAKANEPVRVKEFFKPGLDEFSTILPALLMRPLYAWQRRRGVHTPLHIPLHVRSDTVTGNLLLRFVASLKRRRRQTPRFRDEQALIDRWLGMVKSAASLSPELAREAALCGRLIKGYGDTRQRAHRSFALIADQIFTPALAGHIPPATAASKIAEARGAALADEEGKALDTLLSSMSDADPTRDDFDTPPQKAAAAAE